MSWWCGPPPPSTSATRRSPPREGKAARAPRFASRSAAEEELELLLRGLAAELAPARSSSALSTSPTRNASSSPSGVCARTLPLPLRAKGAQPAEAPSSVCSRSPATARAMLVVPRRLCRLGAWLDGEVDHERHSSTPSWSAWCSALPLVRREDLRTSLSGKRTPPNHPGARTGRGGRSLLGPGGWSVPLRVHRVEVRIGAPTLVVKNRAERRRRRFRRCTAQRGLPSAASDVRRRLARTPPAWHPRKRRDASRDAGPLALRTPPGAEAEGRLPSPRAGRERAVLICTVEKAARGDQPADRRRRLRDVSPRDRCAARSYPELSLFCWRDSRFCSLSASVHGCRRRSRASFSSCAPCWSCRIGRLRHRGLHRDRR